MGRGRRAGGRVVAHQQLGLQSGPREEHHHHCRRARRQQRQNTAGAADTRDAHRRDDGSARTARRCAPSPGRRNARISARSRRAGRPRRRGHGRGGERAEENRLEVSPPLDAPEFREYPSDVLNEDMCLQANDAERGEHGLQNSKTTTFHCEAIAERQRSRIDSENREPSKSTCSSTRFTTESSI